MRTDYDSPWKEALSLYLEGFLRLFFPEIHQDIDWSYGYQMLDAELQAVTRALSVARLGSGFASGIGVFCKARPCRR